MAGPSQIADYLRGHVAQLVSDWEAEIAAEVHELEGLDRRALIDHLPEVLGGLVAWMEGRGHDAATGFRALADGHALQRLGFGVRLGAVTHEYACLRRVVLRRLLALPPSETLREELVRFNDGLDRAVALSIQAYTERRDYVRDRFVSILAHDLRNPLGASAMATNLLLRSDALAETDRKRVLAIARANDRMDRMIHDVLEFARAHLAGGLPSTPIGCDLAQICRDVVDELQLAHPDRALRLELEGDLEATLDVDRVHQALGNLLKNAIDHGEDPIVVRAWEGPDRLRVFTRVSNRGRPIPADLLPRIFEPFAQATDRSRGVGLGLYIVAQIARAHGGDCKVVSGDEETAFTIEWPRVPRSLTPDRP